VSGVKSKLTNSFLSTQLFVDMTLDCGQAKSVSQRTSNAQS